MKNIYMTPCLYGVCYYDEKNCACAYVDDKGKQYLVSNKNKVNLIVNNISFLRGIEYLIFGLYYFIKNLVKMPVDYNSGVSGKIASKLKFNSKIVFVIIFSIISIALGLLFVSFIPMHISAYLSHYKTNLFVIRLVNSVIRILFVLLLLLVLKGFTPFKQFYRFNGCDFNANGKVKLTNFLNFVVTSFLLSIFVLSIVGFSSNIVWKPLINLIICLICFSINYEILYAVENSKLMLIKKVFGITLMLVTESPTKTEKYISLSAYNEVEFMKNKKRGIVDTKLFDNSEISFSSVYAEVKEKLKSAEIEDVSEADWIICEVLGISRGKLRLQTKISQDEKKKIENAVLKRIKGEPITKIFGRTNFYGYDFKVTKDVLSPRQETEILVENALKCCFDKCNVLDMCTGSGIIAVCIAKNSKANVTAVDISSKALCVAKENAENNGVKITFKESNLFNDLKKNKKFDIITCNPPYIPTQDIDLLDKEVKDYDPIIALDGGEDGLNFYRKIIDECPSYLKESGKLVLEIGIGQKNDIKNLLKTNFEEIKVIKDYNKIDRVVICKLKGNKNVRTNRKN